MLSQLKSLDFVSRRSLLEYAAKAMLGVTVLPGAMAFGDDKAASKSPRKDDDKSAATGTAKHVIFLYMNGAMTHLDTFDLKPGRETQGDTKGISTSVSGMQFGETLPELAKLAKEMAVIR
ncbi:MAG TPA: DUF1501 domain-containing protein, partial [Schlesneria sp.]